MDKYRLFVLIWNII